MADSNNVNSITNNINENDNAGNEGMSSWWGSWISSAKTKSASVLEAVKKDLDEITTVVKTEVSNAGAAIGGTLRLDEPESTANTVKRSFSTFMGQLSEALIPSLDEDDAEALLITSDGTVTLTGFQKHLAELQSKDETYLDAPDDKLAENYKRWLEVIEQDQFTENRLDKHLTNSQILSEKYGTLVPDKLSHMEFWKRYLFKRAMLEDALANSEIAERKAKSEQDSVKTTSPGKTIIETEQPKRVIDPDSVTTDATEDKDKAVTEKGDDIKWENEDFGGVEISEEEQTRLLQEYENEMKEREEKRKQITPIGDKLKEKEEERREKIKKNNPNTTKTTTGKKLQKNETRPGKSTSTNNTTTPSPKKSTKSADSNQNSPDSTTKLGDDENRDIVSIQKDHFSSDSKDDTASDESWEKDFDLAEK